MNDKLTEPQGHNRLLCKMKSGGRASDRRGDQCCVSKYAIPNQWQFVHAKTQEHRDGLWRRRSYLRRKIRPTLRFYAKSRKIMRATRTRSILSKKKANRPCMLIVFSACVRKSVPRRYTHALVHANSSVASATL